MKPRNQHVKGANFVVRQPSWLRSSHGALFHPSEGFMELGFRAFLNPKEPRKVTIRP